MALSDEVNKEKKTASKHEYSEMLMLNLAHLRLQDKNMKKIIKQRKHKLFFFMNWLIFCYFVLRFL